MTPKYWYLPPIIAFCAIIATALAGCSAIYHPPDPGKIPVLETSEIRQRAVTKQDGNVRVSVAALAAGESRKVFGLPMAEQGIQPVWIEIENRSRNEYFFAPVGVDRNYYAPFEIAWKFRGSTSKLNFTELGLAFDHYQVPLWIGPGKTVSGFVFTSENQGAKAVAIDLVSDKNLKHFGFVVEVPGLRADYLEVDWDNLYKPSEIRQVSATKLRNLLRSLPCCAIGGDRSSLGDPLNLVIIAPAGKVVEPFIRQGWDLTETIHGGAVWKTLSSSIFRGRYRTSPVSPLYVFDRRQDIALQKARETVDERNHLRLWLTPYELSGREVWIGQISRDIGIRFTGKTIVTHKIDPDVDETRDYLAQDLLASQYVSAIGYVRGVGRAGVDKPRFNYTDDPYWTDGLRLIIELSERPVPISQVKYLDWAPPPETRVDVEQPLQK